MLSSLRYLFRFIRSRFIPAILVSALLGIGLIVYASFCIRNTSSPHLYDSVDSIPATRTGLVLGCTETLGNGRPNLYFRFRIDAASELYHAGKCRYLIVSGDNSRHSYDEPTDMANALIAKGVPENRIFKDYAGFRTLDSVIRAREIFGQDKMVIISQPFHNERAIYIAREHGIEAIGYNARKMDRYRAIKTKLREQLAKVKTVLDVKVLQTKPKFLGPPVEIPTA